MKAPEFVEFGAALGPDGTLTLRAATDRGGAMGTLTAEQGALLRTALDLADKARARLAAEKEHPRQPTKLVLPDEVSTPVPAAPPTPPEVA